MHICRANALIFQILDTIDILTMIILFIFLQKWNNIYDP